MTRTRIFANAALALSLTAGLSAATRTASAQSSTTRMTVTVPFAFSADKKPLPAGTYTVAIDKDGFLTFNDSLTGKTVVVMVRTDSYTANKGGSRLTFRRESGQTYLSQIWVAGSSVHSELISHPRPQRELASVSQPDSTIELAAE